MCDASILSSFSSCKAGDFSFKAGYPPRSSSASLKTAVTFCHATELSTRRCDFYDFSSELVPYVKAWDWQKLKVDSQKTILDRGDETAADCLILLQHRPVYTLGTRSSLDNLKFDPNCPPVELHRTERGGEVTYHGPGQLVMYPILDLRHHKMDLHWYLRSLEEVIILTLASACNIVGERAEGMTGVWSGGKKVAAIGVRVTKWITYHGIALNVTTNLEAFDEIIPCGLHLPVASIQSLTSEEEADSTELIQLVGRHLVHHFASVFSLEIIDSKSQSSLPL